MASASPEDTDHRQQGLQYWGYLFQQNKCPSEKLDRLLRGIATAITTDFEPNDNHNDLTPTQLAKFYRSVGGDYDALFLDMVPSSVAFIYKSLGCLHSLQPSTSPDEIDSSSAPNPYSSPTVPALKPRGFVTWQSIQILLDPAEHVPFVRSALQNMNIVDPFTGEPFPKTLPAECFPDRPDTHMVAWHEGVGERLRVEADHAKASYGPDPRLSAAATPADTPHDEKTDASGYFGGRHSSAAKDRPAIVRGFSKAAPHVKHGGKAVALTLQNIVSPNLWAHGNENRDRSGSREPRKHKDDTPTSGAQRQRRRRSDGHPHAHFEDDRRSSEEDTTAGSGGPPRQRSSRTMPPPKSRHSHHASMPGGHHSSTVPPRRTSSRRVTPQASPSTSEESFVRPVSPRRRPRRHRSHELESSPRTDFDQYERPSRATYGSDRPISGGSSRYAPPRQRRSSEGRARDSPSPAMDRGAPGAGGYFPAAEYAPRDRDRDFGPRDHTRDRDRARLRERPRTAANSSRPRSELLFREVPPLRPATSGARPAPNLQPRAPPPSRGTQPGAQEPPTDFRDPFSAGAAPSTASSGLLSPDELAPQPIRRRSDGGLPTSGPGPPPPTSSDSMSSPSASHERAGRTDARDGDGWARGQRSASGGRRSERPANARWAAPVDGVSGRRYPNEALWR